MAFLSIPNVAIRGIAACVPSTIEENINLPLFKEGEAERVIAQTGIERKRVVSFGTTTSDLGLKAANKLIGSLGWERDSIHLLIFASSSRDYITPQTSCILQDRLGLSEECYTMDIPTGCPGWVNALSTAMSIMQTGQIRRGIIINGDTSSSSISPDDKETRPLFGDAAAATALEYDETSEVTEFEIGTRGEDYKAIITPSGGFRNRVTEESLRFVSYGEHLVRRAIDDTMDGMSVFAFGISVAPSSVNALINRFNINKEEVDYWLFHQANQYMNEKIRKKLKLDISKTPLNLKDFGNVSSAAVPLNIVCNCRERYANESVESIGCCFGVGLAWGTVHFKTKRIVCLPLIEY